MLEIFIAGVFALPSPTLLKLLMSLLVLVIGVAGFFSEKECDCIGSFTPKSKSLLRLLRMVMVAAPLVYLASQQLSGGERGIATVLYKRPRILFLDDATSHLDIAKEHEVNAAVKALNITRVIVPGRGRVVRDAALATPC